MTIPLVNNFVGVQLSELYFELQLYNGNLIWVDEKGLNREAAIPPANYKLICVWPKVSEEQAREIVEWYGKGDGSIDEAGVGDTFWCYDDSEFCFDTALESLQSLLTSKGLSGTVAILEVLK